MPYNENHPVVFRSAVTWSPVIFVAAMMIGASIWILTISPAYVWYSVGILALCALIFYVAYRGTYYSVEGITLKILNPFVIHFVIDISGIRSVTVADLPTIGASLSLRTIMLNVDGRRGIQISPRDRAGFIDCLRKVNPDILIGPGVL